MNNSRPIEPPPGINLGDIYFVVFRHKWKIVVMSLLGLAAAAAFYLLETPPYQTDAKLFIRYISDNHSANPSDINTRVTSMTDGESIMNSEMEILTSFDLAAQVATNIGPDKILAQMGGGNDPVQAASIIHKNLKVEVLKDSSVVRVTFFHPDPTIVRPVLAEIIAEYLDKHLQVHRAIGLSDDALTEETTQLGMQIAQTEDELRMAKTNAGIISIDDAEKSYSEEITQIRRQLFQAETEWDEHQASLNEQTGRMAKLGDNSAGAVTNIPAADLEKYKTVIVQLAFLKKSEDNYLSQQGYTPENKLVKEVEEKKLEVAKTKRQLEEKFPALEYLDVPTSATETATASADSDSRLSVSLPVRIQSLRQQLAQVQADAAKLDTAEAKIAELTRHKQIQESNLKYFATTLDQARIDETIGPGRGDNIRVIQTPSPAAKDFHKFFKTVFMLLASGVGLGVGWAFLIEYVLDRSIKRPIDIQTKLHIPFFLSIPDLNQNSRTRLAAPKRAQLAYNGKAKAETVGGPATVNGALELTSAEVNRRLQSHYDALRDRLVVYFESINLTRKPKLVAVASTHEGAGVSTIAAGLAASLSETGDGRVLLVDMNLEHGAAQQFFNGKPSLQIDDALQSGKRDDALVQENLYVVSEGSNTERLPRALPKRFASLIPKLKASDYDYIIFDMPPVTPTSVTTRLAGYMDTVMLVVESEKSDTQVTQQANALLAQANANVTAVLNKTRQYIPARMHKDILGGEQF
jgi:uncharacterized protein involved in exopolysaccharide biosynthesis/Mrp family chromosome partitioning ATPase